MKRLFFITILFMFVSSAYAADPAITSTPITSVDQSSLYSYTLTGTDSDGDILFWSEGASMVSAWLSLAKQVEFTEKTDSDNPFDGVDVGDGTQPAFVDIDNDGDFDVLIGERTNLNYYENTGTKYSPVFTKRTGANDPFSHISTYFNECPTPTFIDIDDDGDYDMFYGERDGVIHYYKNTGTVDDGSFEEQTGDNNPLGDISHGGYSYVNITFADIDGDGDFDTVLGGDKFYIKYYENVGDKSNPEFILREGEGTPFYRSGDHIAKNRNATPFFVDDDDDGDFDMYYGQSNRTIKYFKNLGDSNSPVFTRQKGDDNPLDIVTKSSGGVAYSAPKFVDIDFDGNPDAFIGEYNGTISYYENISDYIITGTPSNDDVGVHDVSVVLSDGANSVEQDFQLTVVNVNDAPTITISSTLTTDEDNSQSLTFTYEDIDGDTVTASEGTAPSNGSISIDGAEITYTPDADYNGDDSFVISFSDGQGAVVDKTINVTVNSINDNSAITIESSLTTDEDNNQSLTFTYTDVDGDTVTASEQTEPSHGSISISGTEITYTPEADYNGSDSFTLTLTDGQGYTVDKAITVTVNSINDAPTITISSTLTTDEDNNQNLTFSYEDIDGDTVTASEEVAPSHGSIAISGTEITYTPETNYNGSDSFTVNFMDGQGYTTNKVITVTVNSVNDIPVIVIDSTLTTYEDGSQSLTFSINDVENNDLNLVVESDASNGAATVSGSDVVYTPDADYHGSDSFIVSTTDSDSAKTTKEIRVTVSAINDDPVISIESTLTTDEDNNQSLTFSYTDVDGDTVNTSEKVAPSHGSISISGDMITYTPTPNYNGSDSFTLSFKDGQGASVDKLINVTVNSVNDIPSITIDNTMGITKNAKGRVTYSFSDVESSSAVVTVQAQALNGVVTIDYPEVTYTPNLDYVGSDEFTLAFEDDDGAVIEKFITVNITSESVNGLKIVNNNSVRETVNSDDSHSFDIYYENSTPTVDVSATGKITYSSSSGRQVADIDASDKISFNKNDITVVSTINNETDTIVILSDETVSINVERGGAPVYDFQSSIPDQKVTKSADGSISISAVNSESESSVSVSRTKTEFISIFVTENGTREVRTPLVVDEKLLVELMVVEGEWQLKIDIDIPDNGLTF